MNHDASTSGADHAILDQGVYGPNGRITSPAERQGLADWFQNPDQRRKEQPGTWAARATERPAAARAVEQPENPFAVEHLESGIAPAEQPTLLIKEARAKLRELARARGVVWLRPILAAHGATRMRDLPEHAVFAAIESARD